MNDYNHIHTGTKERFSFLSFGKSLRVQRVWLYIVNYMYEQITLAIQLQKVNSVFSLKDTTTFDICRSGEYVKEDVSKGGDIVFHIPLAVTNVSPRHYAELSQQLSSPIISIGQIEQNFCSILKNHKSIVDILICKEIVKYYTEWIVKVNPELLTSSYSIPIYLYIINHVYPQQTINVNLSDLSQALSAGTYEYFSDFEKRILKPVKSDFDKGLLEGLNAFTFDYKINRKNYFGKKSEISLTLKPHNYQEFKQNHYCPVKVD